jgi:hypothetical protein
MKKISTAAAQKKEKVEGQKLTIGLDLGGRWKTHVGFARAGTWAAMSGYNRDTETPGRANRRCTSARREIPI